jgi:hypothetical protein
MAEGNAQKEQSTNAILKHASPMHASKASFLDWMRCGSALVTNVQRIARMAPFATRMELVRRAMMASMGRSATRSVVKAAQTNASRVTANALHAILG